MQNQKYVECTVSATLSTFKMNAELNKPYRPDTLEAAVLFLVSLSN